MLTEISVSMAVGLLILAIYLMQLVVKQKRNLNRFREILDVEAEQEKVKATLEAEKQKINTALTKLHD